MNEPRSASASPENFAAFDWQRDGAATSRWCDVQGVRLHLREWAPARDGAPPLLLLHGYRAHARWWDWIAPQFTDRFRVLALDFSGMGDSGWRAHYDSTTYVHELLDLVDALGIHPVAVGHSFGGSTLARACGERPDAFARAILLDAWFTLPGHPIPQGQVRLPGQVRPARDRASLRARYVLAPEQDAPHPELLEHAAWHSMHERADGWHWKFDPALPNVINGVGGDEVLRRIVTPTAYVYGGRSRLISTEHARAIAARLPGSSAPHCIPAAQHHMMFDQPDALVAMLRSLLD